MSPSLLTLSQASHSHFYCAAKSVLYIRVIPLKFNSNNVISLLKFSVILKRIAMCFNKASKVVHDLTSHCHSDLISYLLTHSFLPKMFLDMLSYILIYLFAIHSSKCLQFSALLTLDSYCNTTLSEQFSKPSNYRKKT